MQQILRARNDDGEEILHCKVDAGFALLLGRQKLKGGIIGDRSAFEAGPAPPSEVFIDLVPMMKTARNTPHLYQNDIRKKKWKKEKSHKDRRRGRRPFIETHFLLLYTYVSP